MKSGNYRWFFHIGPIGIKIAKFVWSEPNKLEHFLVAIVMNLLERKRYKYYTLHKTYKNNTRVYKYNKYVPLIPTYFTCGLFNIVKYVPVWKGETDVELFYKDKWVKLDTLKDNVDYENIIDDSFNNLIECPKCDNIGIWNNKLYALDYGDFNTNMYNEVRILLTD